jgi:hypothetical protein
MRWLLTNGILVFLALSSNFARETSHVRADDRCYGSGDPQREECVEYDDFLHWKGFVHTPGGAVRIAISGDYAYALDENNIRGSAGLRVIDIANFDEPVLIGSLDTLGSPWRIAVSGGFAYVADMELGLQVFDVSDPTAPALIGSEDPRGGAWGIAVSGHHAFVATSGNFLDVFDVTDPSAPRLVVSMTLPGISVDVKISGSYAYVSVWGYWWGQLQIIDISDPLSPTIVGTASTPGVMSAVTISDQLAYVGVRSPTGLQMIDVTNPAAPVMRGWLDTPSAAKDVGFYGDHALVAVGLGFWLVDVADPDSPSELGGRAKRNHRWTESVAISEDRLFATNDSSVLVYDLANGNFASVAGSVDVEGDYGPHGVVLSGRYAYVAAGYDGLQVIDLESLDAPVFVASVLIPDYAGSVAISGDHAFVTAYGNGLQVVDIANPLAPIVVSSIHIPERANNVTVAGNHAYVAAGAQGLHIVDINDPENPVIVGSVQTPDLAFDVVVSGNHAYVQGYYEFQVVDVSDRAAPVMVASLSTGQLHFDVDLTLSGKRVYMASNAGLDVIDISNPTDPVLDHHLITPGSVKGVAISGRFAYVADGEDGLKIFDIADPSLPSMFGSTGITGIAEAVAVSDDRVYVTASNFNYPPEPGGFRVARLACEPPIEIPIDVKPGSDPNSINCRNRRGVIPVAILSTEDFDATFVDPTTVRFGPAEASIAHNLGASASLHEEDVDGDGDTDLVLHFRFDETGIECEHDHVELTAETYTGQRVAGDDEIRTISGRKKR